MLHAKNISYKKISRLNKNFPSGFKTVYFRTLLDRIKLQIITNKISQMVTPEFQEICSIFDFTADDISNEKFELIENLGSNPIKQSIKSEKKSKDSKKNST